MSDKTYMRAVFDFLRARDISKYKSGRDWARLRPVTETYEAMQEASKRPITRFFEEICEHLVGEAPAPWADTDDDRHFGSAFPTPPSGRPGAPTATVEGEKFRANDLHRGYVHWLEQSGYTFKVTTSKWQHELSALAAEKPWLTKQKTQGLIRCNVNVCGMINDLLEDGCKRLGHVCSFATGKK